MVQVASYCVTDHVHTLRRLPNIHLTRLRMDIGTVIHADNYITHSERTYGFSPVYVEFLENVPGSGGSKILEA